MDRETAIEWIEQIKHRISGGDEDFDRQRKEALDMAIVDMKICDANNAGWISIKDRLPEGECIAYSSKFGEMMMGFISETDESDTGYCCDSNTEWLSDVTHWMPLPELPKEET